MSNLKKQLSKLELELSKLKLKNGNTVEKELRRHASILGDCIMEELDNVYDSYSPKVYRRSYGLYNSLYIGDIKLDVASTGTSLSINLGFDGGAMHENFDGQEMNVALLLNEGWQTHGKFADVPYFGHREGTKFIQNGIERYKRSVKKPFAVRMTINGDEEMF